MAANATRMMALGMVGPLAEEVASQIDDNLPVGDGDITTAKLDDEAVTNAKVAADAAIETTKLADGTELAALAGSDLVTAVGAPAAYSETPADIAAALVAAGLMEADAG